MRASLASGIVVPTHWQRLMATATAKARSTFEATHLPANPTQRQEPPREILAAFAFADVREEAPRLTRARKSRPAGLLITQCKRTFATISAQTRSSGPALKLSAYVGIPEVGSAGSLTLRCCPPRHNVSGDQIIDPHSLLRHSASGLASQAKALPAGLRFKN